MTFVTAPLAIAGLASVALPIIIFLLWRQRRRPVEWAAMRFLLEAFRKHRRRLRLEQLLLLIVRCLVLLLLGLALARPLLESSGVIDPGGSRVVYFVIDNGIASSLSEERNVTSLDAKVELASEIISLLDAGDRVGVITAARPAQAVLAPPSSDHASVVDLLSAMEVSMAPTDLPGALQQLSDALESVEDDASQIFAYLLSDFRAGSAALEEPLPGELSERAEQVVLLATSPASTAPANTQILAMDAARHLVLSGVSDGSGQVAVRMSRHGAELAADVSRVRLIGEGLTHVEPAVVQWSPGQTEATAEFILDVATLGDREMGISAMIDDDPLNADNQRHAALAVRKQIRALLINRRSFGFDPSLDRFGPGQWLLRALEPAEISPMEVVEVEPAALDAADLRQVEVALLSRPDLLGGAGWSSLRSFVDRGGLLFIVPPHEANVHQWVDHLSEELSLSWVIGREVQEYPEMMTLAAEQPRSALLRMISADLEALTQPIVVHKALPIDMAQTQADIVLALADTQPLMIAGTPTEDESDDPGESSSARSRGMVVLLAISPQLEWTNLPSQPLMVPLVHETIRQGVSLIRGSQVAQVGTRPPLAAGAAATALIAPSGERITLDRDRRPEEMLKEPGLHRIVDRGGREVGVLPVNIEVEAARVEPQPEAAVKSWLARSGSWEYINARDLGAALRQSEGRSPLAGILLLIMIGLLILETLLGRFFSHAEQATAVGAGGIRPTTHERGLSGAGAAS